MRIAIYLFFILTLLSGCSKKSPEKTVNGMIGKAEISVVYHAPSKRDRVVMGQLVPYKKVWRTGANNATTFESSEDILVEGKLLRRGKYELFTIPDESEWIIIFNEFQDQWGTDTYSEDKDVLRVKVPVEKMEETKEQFTIEITGTGVNLMWENTNVTFDITNP